MEEILSVNASTFDSSSVSENSNPYGFGMSAPPTMLGGSNVFWVTNTNDSGEGSLREAIQMANDLEGHDIVKLSSELEKAIKLNTEILITDDVTIEGNGNRIRGAGEDRLLR